MLKRLRSALASGDRVLGVIRGTAVNQDGRSNGLTAPNGPAQQAVVRQALARSGLAPREIDYIEAHGTGTELGDPTEMGALAAVFGGDRAGVAPLRVGSAKTNLGHLEGAAGVAGLIKVCLSLVHEETPPHPFFDPQSEGPNGPSPHIDWSQPIEVPSQRSAWRRGERVRRSGVSSFGFGGTNAHLIVEEPPVEALAVDASSDSNSGPVWVTLSARTPAALGALARSWSQSLPDAPLAALAWAANTGRAAHAERLAVRAENRAELIEQLAGDAERLGPDRRRGSVGQAQGVGWLFGGQGGVRPQMGRQLYERFDAFAAAWNACEAVLAEHWPRSLRTICWDEPQRWLQEVDSQPALVAWQVSLGRLWASWAGQPSWVAGHSLGELAAAVSAGMLSLEQAVRLACGRAELLGAIPPAERGGMLAVMAAAEQVDAALAEHASACGGGLSLAADNGPRQSVVSGPLEALAAFAECCGLRTKRLATSHAFHSELVAPAMAGLAQLGAEVGGGAPQIGFLSTLTGRAIEGPLPGDYWANQLREPVRFAEALRAAPADGATLELSPTPVLRSLAERDVTAGSGWRDGDEADGALAATAELWTAGVAVDFRSVGPPQRLSVSLPTYPFERRRHWFRVEEASAAAPSATPAETIAAAGLLGARVDVAGDSVVFETDLSRHGWLADHRLLGEATLPAAAYLELMWAAGRELLGGDSCWPLRVVDLQLERRMTWSDTTNACRVQTLATPLDGGGWRLEVLRRESQQWRRHAQARLQPAKESADKESAAGDSFATLDADATPWDIDQLYARAEAAGLAYGPAFRGLAELNGSPGTAESQLQLPDQAPANDCLLPPPLLDAALQTIAAALPKNWNNPWAPKYIQNANVHVTHENRFRLRTQAVVRDQLDADEPPTRLTADVRISDATGATVAELYGVELARMPVHEKSRDAVTTIKPVVQEQEGADQDRQVLESLQNADAEQRQQLLLEHLQRRLAVVMDMTVEELPPEHPLDTLGLDSLMAFELRDDLENSLGVDVPMDLFLQRMTLRKLAGVIEELWLGDKKSRQTEEPEQANATWIEGAL